MSLFEPLLLNQSNPFDHFRAFLTRNSDSVTSESNTQMDWKETRDAHIFEIDLPGFSKEDVKLEVKESRVLCIKAEKKEKKEQEEEEELKKQKDEKKKITWHCRERRNNGMLSREFRLPENAKVDDVKASMHDGVLTITVPKDETNKKHKKEVQIFEGMVMELLLLKELDVSFAAKLRTFNFNTSHPTKFAFDERVVSWFAFVMCFLCGKVI